MNRQEIVSWWEDLQPDANKTKGGDRATLARLRRCGTTAELILEPATIALFRQCMAENPRDLTLIALAAGVLATVRANDPMHPARRVGPRSPKEPDTARLKPLRFRRLMEADGTDERLIAFRRLAAMAEYKLNIQELVGAFLDWGPNRQRDWVLEYWDAARRPADPAQIPSATEIA